MVEQPSQTLMMEFPYFRWMASVFGKLVTWQVHRLLLASTGILCQAYTLWLFNIAMENDLFKDELPMKPFIYKGFSMAMLNSQMVV